MKGHVVICAALERYRIKFLTFASFLDGPLHDLAVSHHTFPETPFFPEKLLRPIGELAEDVVHYSGPIPDVEFFLSVLDSRETADAKREYVAKRRDIEQRGGEKWTYGLELVNCCTSQCFALATVVVKFLDCCFSFQDRMQEMGICRNKPKGGRKTRLHPFETGSTLPTFAYALLKNHTLPSEEYYTISNEYSGQFGIKDRTSEEEHKYLELQKSLLPPGAPLLRTAFNHPGELI